MKKGATREKQGSACTSGVAPTLGQCQASQPAGDRSNKVGGPSPIRSRLSLLEWQPVEASLARPSGLVLAPSHPRRSLPPSPTSFSRRCKQPARIHSPPSGYSLRHTPSTHAHRSGHARPALRFHTPCKRRRGLLFVIRLLPRKSARRDILTVPVLRPPQARQRSARASPTLTTPPRLAEPN